jgi:hypothetical protein
MTKRGWRFGALIATASLIVVAVPTAAVVSTAGASPSHAKVKAPGAISHKVAVNGAAIAAYWTPARMASAKAIDVIPAGTPNLTADKPSDQGAGVPGTSPGGLPKGASESPATAPTNGTGTGTGSFDSYQVQTGNYKKYPYDVNGKVFFTNDGADYVCSGTVVGSASGSSDENEVWTAGHCLINTESLTGVWDSSLEFVPGYNGSAIKKKQRQPFGVFTWTGGAESNTAWVGSRDFSEDEAAFTVNANAKGILGNVTGWAAFAWNYSPYEDFSAFGYPAASPYNGEFLDQDWATTYELDTGIGGAGSAPMGMGSDFTGGSSGGGWTFGWSPTGTGYVDGHNDYVYSSVPNTMFSPYQDTLSNTVRCFGATSC